MNFSNTAQWIDDTMRMTQEWAASRQKCKRKAVGVAVVWLGVNGEVAEVCRAHNGPAIPGAVCSGVVGGCGCAHAEPRAVLAAKERTTPRKPILLSEYSPCTNCANIIIDSQQFQGVVYRTMTEHDVRGWDLLCKTPGMRVLSVTDLMTLTHDVGGVAIVSARGWARECLEAWSL